MTAIIAIRPEPGLSATIEAGRELGLTITGMPLFEIRPVRWSLPDPDRFDALLIGSANAIRHGGEQLAALKDKPVYAVGSTTARMAEQAGFRVAATGTGGLQGVIDAITDPIRLLRISGRDHVGLSLPAQIQIETIIAYESIMLPIELQHVSKFRAKPIALLHSALQAEHFARECDRLDLDRGAITLVALGPRIADAAGENWRDIHVSDEPNDAALLALVKRVCQ